LDADPLQFCYVCVCAKILPLSKNRESFTRKGGNEAMRKLLVVILFIASVACFGCATTYQPANPVAFGRNWELLGVSPDQNQVFYDPQSTIVSNGVVKAQGRGVDRLGYELIGKLEVDCTKNLVRSLNCIKYDRNQSYVGPVGDSDWIQIDPNSPAARLARKYCR